jgi:hypothetical protein
MKSISMNLTPNLQTALVRPTAFGLLAFGGLIAVYFGALTLVSGWQFTASQSRGGIHGGTSRNPCPSSNHPNRSSCRS